MTTMPTSHSPRRRSQRTGLIDNDARHDTALVILDMISNWQFPDADALLREAAPIAAAIARLKRRCAESGIPVIYANDNSGQWRSDFKFVVRQSLEAADPGSDITRQLEPGAEDYFVLKPKHSAFFSTPLEILLDHLGTRRLLVVGIAGDQCVMNTAVDARMRDFDVVVPSDGIASLTQRRNQRALDHLRDVLGLDTTPSHTLVLQRADQRSA